MRYRRKKNIKRLIYRDARKTKMFFKWLKAKYELHDYLLGTDCSPFMAELSENPELKEAHEKKIARLKKEMEDNRWW